MNKVDDLSISRELKEKAKDNGFGMMTDIQRICIPELLKGKDVIVQSPTGTGKTLAFLLPLLHHIYNDWEGCKSKIVAVIITPTRELSLQIKAVADLFKAQCESFIGGIDIELDYEKMKNSFSIVVGTPGRLLELINWDTKRFSRVSHVILDEADKLLSFGFEQKLIQIMKLLPKERSTGLFSATIDSSVDRLSKISLRNPVRLQAKGSNVPADLELEYIILSPVDKLMMLLDAVKNERCIVFFATCNQVDFFHSLFVKLGFSRISKIHGKMSQSERGRTYEEFMNSDKALFCTDVVARGIDFKDIELVIHFDIPKDYNNIVHRSGRTARNGGRGRSLVFVMPNEKAYLEFLKLKSISVSRSQAKELSDPGSGGHEDIRSKMDSELLDLSVKAFVSYIRSYKEHIISYILDYKELNFNSLAELFFLEKIPSMTELKNVKFEKFAKPKKRNTEREDRKKKRTKPCGKDGKAKKYSRVD